MWLPILVLLAPPGKYNWMIRHLVPFKDFQIPDNTVASIVHSKIQQLCKKSTKVAISNSFCTIHVPIKDAEWMKSICSVELQYHYQGYGNQ